MTERDKTLMLEAIRILMANCMCKECVCRGRKTGSK